MFKIDNECKTPNVPVTIRFTEELHEELHEYAAKNKISFNYLVLKCCRYALDNAEKNENE